MAGLIVLVLACGVYDLDIDGACSFINGRVCGVMVVGSLVSSSAAAGDVLDGGIASVVFWVFIVAAIVAAFWLGGVLHRR